MRVTLINDMLWGGGRERRIVQLISGLNANGLTDIDLILLDERVDYPDVYQKAVKLHPLRRFSRWDVTLFWRLAILLIKIKPDVVVTWAFMSTMFIAPLCYLLRIRCIGAFVADCSPPRSLLHRAAIRVGYALCETVVSNTHAGHQAYGTPEPKRTVIPNGFAPERLNVTKPSQILRNELGIRPDTKVIAMIGRFDEHKDYDTLMNAGMLLAKKRTDFVIVCIGQGRRLDETRAKAAGANWVRFTGFVADAENYIAMSDVGVLCTNAQMHAEGISNAVLEFMAFGRPVVVTEGAGISELVRPFKDGLVVPAGDADALSAALTALLDDQRLATCLGGAGAERIRTEFSLDLMAERFVALLGGSAGPAGSPVQA